MLKLIQVEFLKLRRRKFIWLMLLAALFMPLAAVFYFSSVKGTGVDPIMFYKWTAFSYTPWIILPVVLGMLCTMLMYNENQYDMLKQLWIVPVNKMAYFFSKFAVVLVYSICFMLVTATASILTGVLSGYIPFDSESVLYLLRKCMEISLLTAFAVLPVLAVAAAQKGYILPVCLTLTAKDTNAPTPLAKFNALALPAAVTKSYPKYKKPKIRKEPVPGPKKPS